MNKYGCAPIYFIFAMVFLVSGGTLIYLGHHVIGPILMMPGVILIILSIVTVSALYRFERGDEKIKVVVTDRELLNVFKKPKKSQLARKKGKIKSKKKR